MAAATKTAARDMSAEVAFREPPFLTPALKAPTLGESVARLAERARAESWSHEEFLVACLQREVSARESHGGEAHPRRPISRPQESRGVRLRPRPRPQTRHHRAPGNPGLRGGEGERGVSSDRPVVVNTAVSSDQGELKSPTGSRITCIRRPFRLPRLTCPGGPSGHRG